MPHVDEVLDRGTCARRVETDWILVGNGRLDMEKERCKMGDGRWKMGRFKTRIERSIGALMCHTCYVSRRITVKKVKRVMREFKERPCEGFQCFCFSHSVSDGSEAMRAGFITIHHNLFSTGEGSNFPHHERMEQKGTMICLRRCWYMYVVIQYLLHLW